MNYQDQLHMTSSKADTLIQIQSKSKNFRDIFEKMIYEYENNLKYF